MSSFTTVHIMCCNFFLRALIYDELVFVCSSTVFVPVIQHALYIVTNERSMNIAVAMKMKQLYIKTMIILMITLGTRKYSVKDAPHFFLNIGSTPSQCRSPPQRLNTTVVYCRCLLKTTLLVRETTLDRLPPFCATFAASRHIVKKLGILVQKSHDLFVGPVLPQLTQISLQQR